jgi:hypothetical protein
MALFYTLDKRTRPRLSGQLPARASFRHELVVGGIRILEGMERPNYIFDAFQCIRR